jgi:hypothetical protein
MKTIINTVLDKNLNENSKNGMVALLYSFVRTANDMVPRNITLTQVIVYPDHLHKSVRPINSFAGSKTAKFQMRINHTNCCLYFHNFDINLLLFTEE